MTRLIAVLAVLTALFGAAASSSSSGTHSTKDVKLTLVAYSTPREAYAKIIEAFQKTPAGRESRSTSRTARPASRAGPLSRASPPTSWPSRSLRTSRA